MKQVVIAVALVLAAGGGSQAADRSMEMATDFDIGVLGQTVNFECTGTGDWRRRLRSAQIVIRDASNSLTSRASMSIDGLTASYTYTLPENLMTGQWSFTCVLRDRSGSLTQTAAFAVVDQIVEEPPVNPPGEPLIEGPIAAHNTITAYNGPATCISCHAQEAGEMLNSLHMKWEGPTPNLTNSSGEELGKAKGGINTFCTYAMSSKAACFSCHVRADGNAPHPAEAKDVDCLMCHSDTYQRKFVLDTANPQEVTNILGQLKTYLWGKVDAQGNYTTVPDFAKMPAGTNMVNVARTVHMPTNKSCLRCHGTAGGGDWVKRGDLGLNSAQATIDEDVHLAKDGANLSCVNCHSALNHKIGGRGIDLRQTEAAAPTCKACHTEAPHTNTTLNNHAQGQVSCQVCHIREYAKGGATEMSRDWRFPVWNQAFCSGQGGFVGEEVKQSFVKPEYTWFDGTSYVYNVGETLTADENGIFPMAKANGQPFDGKSMIYPIKRHLSIMPLHESGKIVPPAIMWMFMTGDFDLAVRKGMEEQGMTGNYSLVDVDAEMLITHGVDPKEKAPSCVECHDNSGKTLDGTKMMPLSQLGYHQVPVKVLSCTLCHEQKNLSWQAMHQKHRQESVSCASCHTSEPVKLVAPAKSLCSSCHEYKGWSAKESHKKHFEKRIECISCHVFS